MANSALLAALSDAKMTQVDLASRIGVDEKTVQRWISDERRTPHPRHRASAAAVLEVEEEMLWPDTVKSTVKTGHDREVVQVYPYRSAVPKSLWRDLVTKSKRQLTFAGYTNYFLWLDLPNFRQALARKMDSGCGVRFLVGDPDSPVTAERERIEAVPLTVSTRIRVTLDELGKLRETAPQAHARLSDRHIAMSLFVFDDDMLVSTHLGDKLGHDSPTLHLRRHLDDGLYDRYAAHLDHLWDGAREI